MRPIPALPLLALLAAALHPGAAGAFDEEPLPPEEAFRYSVEEADGTLVVRWDVEDGYYLYREKLGLESLTEGVSLGPMALPDGEVHEDEYFGRQEIYRGEFAARMPYTGGGARTLELEVRAQGCADFGLCYPPQRWRTTVALPEPAAAAAGLSSPFSDRGGGSSALPGGAGGLLAGAGGDEFLPPDEAFRPRVDVLDPYTLEVSWAIAPGYYLYRDTLGASTDSDRVGLAALRLPEGKEKYDEFFGDTEVYYDAVIATLPLNRAGPEPTGLTLELGYQGCAEDGICYPPITRSFAVSLPLASAADQPRDLGDAAPQSEQARLAGLIADGNFLLVLATFFGAGLLLAFTPCVLPMVPILSGIIAGEGDDVTPARGFVLALAYVLGMALTYTIAGAVFAAAGQQAQAVFQQPWILTAFAGLFVVLALGMFGLFDLQMPSAVQSRLAAVSGRQRGGTLIGAVVMGALSSLIVTACVAPPLVASLAVIGQSGDVVRGGAALFALSIGMGTPLLAVGASAGKLLPKAGPWMVAVKNAFGFMMLGLAIWMLGRILPGPVILALWAVLVLMAGVFLGAFTQLSPEAGGARKLGKGFGVLAALYGAVLLVGSLTGADDPLQPLERIAAGGGGEAAHGELEFQRVKTVADVEAAVAAAAAAGRPAMLDFYADWCVSCKEMEKYTFANPAVQRGLAGTVLLQADVTANDEADRELLRRFGLFGPPGIIFFGPGGEERPRYEVVGYMPAERFAEHLRLAIAPRSP